MTNLQILKVAGAKGQTVRQDCLSVTFTPHAGESPILLGFHASDAEPRLAQAYEAAIQQAGEYRGHEWVNQVKAIARQQLSAVPA